MLFYSLDSLVVSIENFNTPKFTPKVNLRIFNGSLSAKTSFMAACILPSVALSGKNTMLLCIFIHLIYSSCQFAKLSESINDGNGCTDG